MNHQKSTYSEDLSNEILLTIHNREALIEKLEIIKRDPVLSGDGGFKKCLYKLHTSSLAFVETILAWNKSKQNDWHHRMAMEHPTTLSGTTAINGSDGLDNVHSFNSRCPFYVFIWNGENYLRKMLSDLDFISDIPVALNFLGIETAIHRNPFLLPVGIDDLITHQRCSAFNGAISTKLLASPWKDLNVKRLQEASFFILLEEFHRKVDETHKASSTAKCEIAECNHRSCSHQNIMHSHKFYPPELREEELNIYTKMINPPAPAVIAICCAHLILKCVESTVTDNLIFLTKAIALSIFRRSLRPLIKKAELFNPLDDVDQNHVRIVYPFVMHKKMDPDHISGLNEAVVYLSAWLRFHVGRVFDSKSFFSKRSSNADNLFAELEEDYSRREAEVIHKTISKPKQYAHRDEDNVMNISVQKKEILGKLNESIVDENDKLNVNSSPDSNKLIPFPVAITVDLTPGSQIVSVNGNVDAARALQESDILRISDAYKSLDWKISKSPTFQEDDKLIFNLDVAYDHSQIEKHEEELRNGTLYRLPHPYMKGVVRPSDHFHPQMSHNDESCRDVSSKTHATTRSNLPIREARVWKLIPQCKDSRPTWRKEFDDGSVPWTDENVNYNVYEEFFRVRISLAIIERDCSDSPHTHCIHQQRVNYFENVSLSNVIDEAFQTVCRWHPRGSLVDNVKWAKLSRNMKFLSNVKNSKHEIDMAFVRHNQERKLDLLKFYAILEDIATIQYPTLPKQDALIKVVWASIVMLPDVNKMMWREAKKMAIHEEAKRVCAQIRIAALVRKTHQRIKYLTTKSAALTIESYIRRFLAHSFVTRLIKSIQEDENYKLRTKCTVMIQREWRRFFWRCQFLCHLEQRKSDDRQKISTARAELREKKERKLNDVVFRDILFVDSTIAAVTIFFRDGNTFHEDAIMRLNVYVPISKETFSFQLEENVVRKCLENVLSSEGRLSWDEMLKSHALKELTNRLMLRVVRRRPIFLFSRRNIIEKGVLMKNVVLKTADDIFILSIYRSPHDTTFTAYQPRTCQQMRVSLSSTKLTEWLRGECPGVSHKHQTKIKESDRDTLYLLQPEYQSELMQWLVKRVLIRRNPKDDSMQLLLQYEAEEERTIKLLTKVQSQWRRFQSQRHTKGSIFRIYEKIFNREFRRYAYRNKNTGESQWEKPKLLGDQDLGQPLDEWRIQETSNGCRYYVNYATGQSSWMSEESAARLLQRRFRSKLESDLLGKKIRFPDVVKAMNFISGARSKYEQDPIKLSNAVNYALLSHCIDLDFRLAKSVYEEVMKLSPNHPLISRVYGIFLLASCQPPLPVSFQTANRLFHEADISDPNQTMIQSATEIYFRWAMLVSPKNPLILLNYALLHQCIYKKYDYAEKIYRAALAVDPTNTLVTDNYSLFIQERYPGGVYASVGPPVSVVHRSKIHEENIEWGDWSKHIDPLCPRKGLEVFWYNRFTKMTQFGEPDWMLVWEARLKRSHCVSQKATTWIEYYDPVTKTNFFKHRKLQQYTCLVPNSTERADD